MTLSICGELFGQTGQKKSVGLRAAGLHILRILSAIVGSKTHRAKYLNHIMRFPTMKAIPTVFAVAAILTCATSALASNTWNEEYSGTGISAEYNPATHMALDVAQQNASDACTTHQGGKAVSSSYKLTTISQSDQGFNVLAKLNVRCLSHKGDHVWHESRTTIRSAVDPIVAEKAAIKVLSDSVDAAKACYGGFTTTVVITTELTSKPGGDSAVNWAAQMSGTVLVNVSAVMQVTCFDKPQEHGSVTWHCQFNSCSSNDDVSN
jgi:hypothetical protein